MALGHVGGQDRRRVIPRREKRDSSHARTNRLCGKAIRSRGATYVGVQQSNFAMLFGTHVFHS